MLNESEATTTEHWIGRKKKVPSVSKAQRRAAGMAKAIQQGDLRPVAGTASADMAASMDPEDLQHYAETKEKGLPQRKTRRMGAKRDHRKNKRMRSPGDG